MPQTKWLHSECYRHSGPQIKFLWTQRGDGKFMWRLWKHDISWYMNCLPTPLKWVHIRNIDTKIDTHKSFSIQSEFMERWSKTIDIWYTKYLGKVHKLNVSPSEIVQYLQMSAQHESPGCGEDGIGTVTKFPSMFQLK